MACQLYLHVQLAVGQLAVSPNTALISLLLQRTL
jgi:hypothetical protein